MVGGCHWSKKDYVRKYVKKQIQIFIILENSKVCPYPRVAFAEFFCIFFTSKCLQSSSALLSLTSPTGHICLMLWAQTRSTSLPLGGSF